MLIYLEVPLDMIFRLRCAAVLASGAACFMLDRSITPRAARKIARRSALERPIEI